MVKGWLLTTALLAVATLVNGLTAQADSPHAAAWEPWAWEGTSGAMVVLLAWLPGLAALGPAQPADGGSPWRRRLAFHAGALCLFSVLHVAGMLALRRALYAALGETYRYGPLLDRFVYEFRKDSLTYAILAGLFWLARPRDGGPAKAASGAFDIRDGAHLIRAPVGEILAATSAGNYVEFVLVDGRRPLMRTTLAAVQSQLGPWGFVRTHRSWLVNAARLTGLRPAGSGDWTVELGEARAPLSRRYPEALAHLKASD
jgi:hypothetical protein